MPPEPRRRAVVLMNLGGPDSPEAVRPFLENLFSDPAIIRLPAVLRLPLARFIAGRRYPAARRIYAELGGGSPLLANTKAQAQALDAELGAGYRCFIAMRYWHPLTAEAVAAVKQWTPEDITLLPLYPQYSKTTSGSSLTEWQQVASRMGLGIATRSITEHYRAPGFIAAIAESIAAALDAEPGARLLFSAHGLPLRLARTGDPYPGQVEETAALIAAKLARPDLDWRLCYQSRVGPLKWLGPSVDEEIARAGDDRVAVIVAPISFVSEHSETLVELDRDYRDLAARCGVPAYQRVPTVGTDPRYIAALAECVRR